MPKNSTLEKWLRRLALTLLLLVVAGTLNLWLAGDSVSCAHDVASVDEILETFRDPPSLALWLEPERNADGNASPHYVRALLPFKANSKPQSDGSTGLLDSALPHLTSAIGFRQCLFTGEIYPLEPDLLATEIVDLEAVWKLLEALRHRSQELRLAGNPEEAENLLVLGLSLGDCFLQDPARVYLMAGLRIQAELLPDLAVVAAQLGKAEEVELAVERAVWVEEARLRALAAVETFAVRTASTAGLAQLRRLATSPELPAGLRGEIAVALSYGHLWHWRGRLLGPSHSQKELLEELGHDADPAFAKIVTAAQNFHHLNLFERLASIETIHHL